MTTEALSCLYRTHDGPPPRPALEALRLDGGALRDTRRRDAERRLFERLAADARLGVARRRAACSLPEHDGWLSRLVLGLARHRADALACRPDQRTSQE
jgi:hypothetical protein